MQVQFASFFIPLIPGSEVELELNRFLRSHTVLRCHTQYAVNPPGGWAVLVEYAQASAPDARNTSKIDYKAVLSPEDFAVFDRLRQTRKRLAEAEGVPAYAVCTNEQLASLARLQPGTVEGFQSVDGLGKAKADKYASALLEAITPPGQPAL